MWDASVRRMRDSFEKLPSRGTFSRASKGLSDDFYSMDLDDLKYVRRTGLFHQTIGDVKLKDDYFLQLDQKHKPDYSRGVNGSFESHHSGERLYLEQQAHHLGRSAQLSQSLDTSTLSHSHPKAQAGGAIGALMGRYSNILENSGEFKTEGDPDTLDTLAGILSSAGTGAEEDGSRSSVHATDAAQHQPQQQAPSTHVVATDQELPPTTDGEHTQVEEHQVIRSALSNMFAFGGDNDDDDGDDGDGYDDSLDDVQDEEETRDTTSTVADPTTTLSNTVLPSQAVISEQQQQQTATTPATTAAADNTQLAGYLQWLDQNWQHS
jgi:hypothetical protein